MGFSIGNAFKGAVKLGTGGLINPEGLEGAEQGYKRAGEDLYGAYERARSDYAPYRDFGSGELANLRNWLSQPGSSYQDIPEFNAPTMDEVLASPGYQFRLDEGRRSAVENPALARGNFFSGNTLRGLEEYGQGFASNEYDKVYGRKRDVYNARNERLGNEFNRRMGLVNLGYGAAGGSAGLSANYGNALANLRVGEGEARTNRAQYPMDLLAGVGGAILGGKR